MQLVRPFSKSLNLVLLLAEHRTGDVYVCAGGVGCGLLAFMIGVFATNPPSI